MTVLDQPQQIQMMRLVTMRHALIFDIDNKDKGMQMTRIKYLGVMQREGLTNKRTKRGALRDLNGYFLLNGLGEYVQWSKKFPDDKPTEWLEAPDGWVYPKP